MESEDQREGTEEERRLTGEATALRHNSKGATRMVERLCEGMEEQQEQGHQDIQLTEVDLLRQTMARQRQEGTEGRSRMLVMTAGSWCKETVPCQLRTVEGISEREKRGHLGAGITPTPPPLLRCHVSVQLHPITNHQSFAITLPQP